MSTKSEAIAALSPEEFKEFLLQLGSLVFNTVPAAAFARHKCPLDTVRDYLDVPKNPSTALAVEFYKDLLGRHATTEKLSETWFGQTTRELYASAIHLLAEETVLRHAHKVENPK